MNKYFFNKYLLSGCRDHCMDEEGLTTVYHANCKKIYSCCVPFNETAR